jgi:hypothetical protein
MSVYKAFNNVFLSLLEDCILVFPNDPDFKKYKKGAKLLDTFNPRKAAQVYKDYSAVYREKINTKDEGFFIQNDYSDIQEVQEDNEIVKFIEKIKSCWLKLSVENKEKIWKYLQTLSILSDKI